jgi:hypothetical protein
MAGTRRISTPLLLAITALVIVVVALLVSAGSADAGSYPTSPPYPTGTGTVTFTPGTVDAGTACYQTYAVPARVTRIEVEAYGSEGDDGVGTEGLGVGATGGLGGLGSEVDTVIDVTPGETLYVGPASEAFAGGAGGLAGMFSGDQPTTAAGQAAAASAGGDGGNASYVSTQAPTGGNAGCSFTPAELNSVLVVAAGGGGGGGEGSDNGGGEGGTEAAGFGGQVPAGPGQNGAWTVDWWQDTALTMGANESPDDAGLGGSNASSVPADATACPSIAPFNSSSSAASLQGGCAGDGGTGASFTTPDFDPTGTGADAGFAVMYCPAGQAGVDGLAQYGGDGGSGWQTPDTNDADVDVGLNPFAATGDGSSDVRSLVKQAFKADPDPTSPIITEESMAAEEADSSLWLNTNPLDTLADTLEGDIAADAVLAGVQFLSNFENALFPTTPLYSVLGCGGEDAPGGTTANGWVPGSATGGGGGGGGGWYGGGGGGAADDYQDSAGGGGGGAGASYIAGDSYSQTLAQTSGSQLGTAQVVLNPVESPPAIVDPSSGCTYGTSGCATGPTFTCVVEQACSDTIDTTGFPNPWVSETSNSTLPYGFGFAETVPNTTQYNEGLAQNPGVGWTPTDAPTTFTLEGGWNLYGASMFPGSEECSLSGPGGTQQTYDNALEATNPDGLPTYTLPTTTIDYSPGTLQSLSVYPDTSSDSLIENQEVFPGGVPIALDATADYSSGCDYSVANRSAGTWSVTGSTNLSGATVSNSSVLSLSAGSGSELAEPVGPGYATVSYTYSEGGVTKSSSYTLEVQIGVPSSIWIASSASACVVGGTGLTALTVVPGEQGQFYVCANYGNGIVENVTNSINWEEPSGLDQAGLAINPATVATPNSGFEVGSTYSGSIAQSSLTGTLTANLTAWGAGTGGAATPQLVSTTLPVTVNWANPTSLSVAGGVGPGQDAQSNESLRLFATATYDNGQTLDVSDLASWSTSNSTLAESGGDGNVQIPYYENGGYASIMATLGGQSSTEQIAVDSSFPPTITITDADGGTVGLGQTDQLTAAAFAGGPVTQNLNPNVTWSSNEPSIATVGSTGLVTVVGGANGQQATITATDGVYQGTFVITANLTHPTSISVTPGTTTIGSGGSVNYTAIGTYPGGYTANVSSLANWTTNEPSSMTEWDLSQLSVAPNQTGNPIVIDVTASLGSAPAADATVTEGVGPPTSLTVSPIPSGNQTSLAPGQTVQLSATAQFGSGSGITNVGVTDDVTWTSTNSSVVTVSQSGLVTAVGHTNNAEADVYATYTDRNVTIASNGANYIITLAEPTSIAVSPATSTLLPGQQETLTATGTYPDGSTANVTSYVTWSSTCSSSQCGVSAGGFVETSGSGQAADPTITATTGSGVAASVSVSMPGSVGVSPTSPTAETMTAGVPYTSATFTAAGGSGSYSWSLSGPGDFPESGLSLSATSGSSVHVTGTPTAQFWQDQGANPFYLELTATDSNNPTGVGGSTFTVLVPVSLVQQQQTIGWTNTLPATAQSGGTISLAQYGASASSGLGVSYSVSDTDGGELCSVQGTQLVLSLAATGTCSVTATANTNAEYSAAPSTITQTVQVQAPLTNTWSAQAPAYVQAFVGCGASLSQLSGCSGQNANGTPTSWVTAWGNYQWASGHNTGTLQGPVATLSVDSSTTGYGTSGQVCTITGTSQVNWLLPGTCVLDATDPAGEFDGNYFTAAPQLQSTTRIVGFVGSLGFSSNAPAAAEAGETYTPTFSAGSPEGNVQPAAGSPATSPSPATPQVTIDQTQSSPAGVCTTNGTTVTFVHAGTCVVGGFQPVSGVYGRTPVPVSGEQTISVGKGSQTISFGSEAAATYIPGDTVTLHPTPGASGNPVTLSVDTSSTSSCAINAQDQVSLTSAGSCVIDAAEAASSDYLSATAKETLTVQNVHLAIVGGLPCSSAYSLLTCVSSGGSTPPLQASASNGADLIMYVALENAAGQPVVPDYNIPVTLASASAGAGSDPEFMTDGAFSDQTTIPAGSPSAMVVYGDQVAGARDVSATGQIGGSQPNISSQPTQVTITPGQVASLTWSTQPPDGVAGSSLGEFDVEAFDQYGNPVPGVAISLTGTNGQAVTISQGATQTTGGSGTARFQSTQIDTAGTYSLTATADGASIETPGSADFTVTTGAAQTLSITGGPTGSVVAGASLPEVQVQVLDGSSNPLPNVPVQLTTRENGSTVTLATGRTGSDGSAATFSSLVISTPGAYAITAVDSDNSGIESSLAPVTITPFTTGLTNAYVSPTGNDARDCAQSTPCATVTGAEAELASSGGVVHVSGEIDESGIDLDVPGVSVLGVPGTDATINGQSSGSSIFTVGGSIAAGQNVTVSGLTLTGGYSGAGGDGGAIMDDSAGKLTVTDDVFTDDSADAGGGAIYTIGGGALLVTASTFTGDSAGVVGGAIDGTENGTGGAMVLLGSTFARDTASVGSAVISGSGSSDYAGDLFDGSCAGNGGWGDDGYNAFSDGSCYPDGGHTGDAPASSAADDFTGSATGGTLTPTYQNPASDLIPVGTRVTLGDMSTVDLCSATDPDAVLIPHAIQTPSGTEEVCNSGASQTAVSAVPQAPTSVVLTANTDGSLSVNWTAPTDDGGLALTGYTVTAYNSSNTPLDTGTVGPNITTHPLTGLPAGSYTVEVTANNADGDSQPDTSTAVAAGVAGSPAQMSFLSTPGSTTAGQALGQFQVHVEDSQGAPVSGVTVALTASPTSGTLSPPITSGSSAVTNSSGIATFSGTTINVAGSYSLVATVPSGGSDIYNSSSQFTVGADVASQVQFSQEPTDGIIGAPLPEYAVAVLDQYGNPVPNAQVRITTPDGTQVDDGSTDSAGDPAVFMTTITNANDIGSTTLTATAVGTSVSDVSTAFRVGQDLDAPTDVTATNSNGTADISWTPPADPSSLITGYQINAYQGGTLYGESNVSGAGSSATFSDLVGDFTFTVTASTEFGITGAESAPSSQAPFGPAGVPAQLQFTQLSTTAQAGLPLPTVEVSVTDAYGNPVAGTVVTLAGGGGVYDLEPANSSGIATFSTDEIDEAGSYTFQAEAHGTYGAGLTYQIAAQSPEVTVTAGAPQNLTIGWSPSSIAGQPLTDVEVYVSDKFNQPDIGQPVTLSVIDTSTGEAPAGWQNVTADAVSDGDGSAVALFHDVTVDSAGSYEMLATAGAVSTEEPFTLTSAPLAPTDVTATGNDDGTATVSWSAPNDGGYPITGYTITPYSNGGALTQPSITYSPTSATSATVSGLPLGGTYTFTVNASNADGAGPQSSPSAPATIPALPPGAPTNVTADSYQGIVSVQFYAPTDQGDSPLTGLTINAYDANGDFVESQSVGTNEGSVQFTDLTATDTYTFTAVATNGSGNGPASQPSAPVAVVPPAPGFPASVMATSPAPGTADVTWTQATDTDGAPVTSYTVTAVDETNSANGGQSVTTADGNTESSELTGLTEGDFYYFTVAATTAGGTSNANSSSPVTIVGDPPGAPTDVSSETNSAQSAQVAWEPPTNHDYIPATSYTVVAVDSTNAANGGQSVTTGGSTYDTTVSGLTGGDAYTFEVIANNAYGAGPAVSTAPVTPYAAPSAPQFVSATPNSDGSVTVNWTPPSTTGGSSIAGYLVTPVDQTTSTSLAPVTAASGTTSVTIPDLGGGDSYAFAVVAKTANDGESPQSNLSTAVATPTVASAPVGVSAVLNGDGSVTVTWTNSATSAEPAGTVDSPITGYTVAATDSTNPGNGGQTVSVDAGTNSATFSRLSPGDSYSFSVQAVNAIGSSAASAPSQPLAMPNFVAGAPTGVDAVLNSDGSISVFWTAPADAGSPITGYTVAATDSTDPAHGGQTVTVDGSTTSADFANLAAGDSYTFTVVAVNGAGSSAASAASQPVIVPAASQPVTLAATASLSISAAPSTIVYGKTITVRGTLTSGGAALAGQKVALLYRLRGSSDAFKQFPALGTTNSQGVVRFSSFKPTTPVQIELTFAGNNSYLMATSSPAEVAEDLDVTLKASTEKLKSRRTVTFTGAIAPDQRGKQVELQVQNGKRWVKVADTRLTAAGRYTLKLRLTKAGRFSYRILAAGLAPYASSTSATVKVTVT